MEVMRHLVGWVTLAVYICGLNAGISTERCIFPFTYGDTVYYSCISMNSDFAWCSLDSTFQGRWRYCTATDPPPCSFPFKFRGEMFYNCIKTGYVLNRTWCSLTDDYSKDKKWKQCSPL
uniref:Fibronectin type-II domain-containing protein n=1 Tax=Cavia porcellus TaxID=10141 RepID=H0W043_CAVPO